MTWQEIIVGIIVLLCIAEVVRRSLRFFRSANNNDNPCASCASGCDLKQLMDAKQQKCRAERKKPGSTPNKKCCG